MRSPAPRGLAAQSVLIVDPALEIRRAIKSALNADPYVVRDAPDGKAALELTTTNAPDCLLLAIDVPGFTGLDLLEALRRPNGDLPCAPAVT